MLRGEDKNSLNNFIYTKTYTALYPPMSTNIPTLPYPFLYNQITMARKSLNTHIRTYIQIYNHKCRQTETHIHTHTRAQIPYFESNFSIFVVDAWATGLGSCSGTADCGGDKGEGGSSASKSGVIVRESYSGWAGVGWCKQLNGVSCP